MAFWRRSRRVERRRARRYRPDNLVAYYWTGGLAAAHPVWEISASGGVLESDYAYYRGTEIRLALELVERPGAERPDGARNASVWARVVRADGNRLCVEFLFETGEEQARFGALLSHVTRRHPDEQRHNESAATGGAVAG